MTNTKKIIFVFILLLLLFILAVSAFAETFSFSIIPQHIETRTGDGGCQKDDNSCWLKACTSSTSSVASVNCAPGIAVDITRCTNTDGCNNHLNGCSSSSVGGQTASCTCSATKSCKSCVVRAHALITVDCAIPAEAITLQGAISGSERNNKKRLNPVSVSALLTADGKTAPYNVVLGPKPQNAILWFGDATGNSPGTEVFPVNYATTYIWACPDFNNNNECDYGEQDVQNCKATAGNKADWFMYSGKVQCCNQTCGYSPFGFCGKDAAGNWKWAVKEDAGQIADLSGCADGWPQFVSDGSDILQCGDLSNVDAKGINLIVPKFNGLTDAAIVTKTCSRYPTQTCTESPAGYTLKEQIGAESCGASWYSSCTTNYLGIKPKDIAAGDTIVTDAAIVTKTCNRYPTQTCTESPAGYTLKEVLAAETCGAYWYSPCASQNLGVKTKQVAEGDSVVTDAAIVTKTCSQSYPYTCSFSPAGYILKEQIGAETCGAYWYSTCTTNYLGIKTATIAKVTKIPGIETATTPPATEPFDIATISLAGKTHDFACEDNVIRECKGGEEPISPAGSRETTGKAIVSAVTDKQKFNFDDGSFAGWAPAPSSNANTAGAGFEGDDFNRTGGKGLNLTAGAVVLSKNIASIADKTTKLKIYAFAKTPNTKINLSLSTSAGQASEIAWDVPLDGQWHANETTLTISSATPGTGTAKIKLTSGGAAVDDVEISQIISSLPSYWCASDGDWTTDLDSKDLPSCEDAQNLAGENAGFKWTGTACCGEETGEYYAQSNVVYNLSESSQITGGTHVSQSINEVNFVNPGAATVTGPIGWVSAKLMSVDSNNAYCKDIWLEPEVWLQQGKTKTWTLNQTYPQDPGGTDCRFRRLELALNQPSVRGGCWNSTTVDIGGAVENGRIASINGNFYSCDLASQEQSALPQAAQTLISGRNSAACGSYNETAIQQWLTCKETGQWITTSEEAKSSPILWTPRKQPFVEANETDNGCCPEDMCWWGTDDDAALPAGKLSWPAIEWPGCVDVGTSKTVDGVTYVCER